MRLRIKARIKTCTRFTSSPPQLSLPDTALMRSWSAPESRPAAGSRGHQAPGQPTMPFKSISLRVETVGERGFARPNAHDAMGPVSEARARWRSIDSASPMPRTNDVFPHGSPCPTPVRNLCLNAASFAHLLLPRARTDFYKMLELAVGSGASISGTKVCTKFTIPGSSEQMAAHERLSAAHMGAFTSIGNSRTPTGGWQRGRDLSLHNVQSPFSIECCCPGPWESS